MQKVDLQWEQWLAKAQSEANKHIGEAKECYKRNFGSKLRKREETIEVGNSFYVHIKRRDENKHLDKFTAVAKDPNSVIKIKGKAVAILRKDKTI